MGSCHPHLGVVVSLLANSHRKCPHWYVRKGTSVLHNPVKLMIKFNHNSNASNHFLGLFCYNSNEIPSSVVFPKHDKYLLVTCGQKLNWDNHSVMSRCMFNTPFCPPSSHTHNTEMIKKTEGRKRGSKGGRNEGSREEGALAIHLILWYIIIWHKYNWNKNTLTSAHCHCDVIAQSPGLPEVVRINAMHLY